MIEKNEMLKAKLDEISALLADEILKNIAEKIDSQYHPPSAVQIVSSAWNQSELLDVTEVAALLKVKKRTVYEWSRTNKIPHRKLGDLLRFDRAEIIAWINKKSVTK
ncbi:MAG: helix-turn-helix domain-containing protein [Pyrinomonadaceae bacterium]